MLSYEVKVKMKNITLSLIVLVLILPLVGNSQSKEAKSESVQLKPFDATEKWSYPYEVTPKKREQFLALLDSFKAPQPIEDIAKLLGKPDRIDDLTKDNKPLSHYESGFLAGSKDKFSYRCIWFARKESKSPGLSDNWLAAYVDKDKKSVLVLHSNWLKK